ncbi:TetR/AcrR family transcriptional regulator [Methanobacterium spitsbergense]|uniref:TetR/AcrR family transcriptional regulator n=1 Tax=Methanobacterium spitsbergense TaxID=2874285 RepID=A0A8T5UZW6_9EURY|nr:TetR/AcrR family transcriptional regulator [Methanobacterium spitsbergense]MBZ2165131.1 TetR/AcrR family transcriptional regulator [Methanobacterium spitsbergense]
MDTKSRIMEESFKLFLKKGFVDVSLNEIRKASNITTGGFYYHFDSKDTLLVAVIEKYIFNYFNSTIRQIRDFEGTPKEKLKTVILSIIGDDITINKSTKLCESSEKIDYRTLHLLLFEGVQKYEIISKHYTEFYYNLLNFIKDVLDEGIAQDIIRRDIDSTEFATFIQTSMVGTVLMWIALPEMPLENRMNSNIDHLWNYITK